MLKQILKYPRLLFNVRFCLLLLATTISAGALISQNTMVWFDPHSNTTKDNLENSSDCHKVKDGYDDELEVQIKEFQARPFFMHTHPQVQKWMKDKYLLECSANIYHAGENTFLQLHLRINSENAKHAYGNLDKGSKLKVLFTDDEHIYMDNIERDRGTAKRSAKYTIYEGIYPLDNLDIKELSKKYVKSIGIVWEEGYQEYEVQNFDLLKNQINCLKQKQN